MNVCNECGTLYEDTAHGCDCERRLAGRAEHRDEDLYLARARRLHPGVVAFAALLVTGAAALGGGPLWVTLTIVSAAHLAVVGTGFVYWFRPAQSGPPEASSDGAGSVLAGLLVLPAMIYLAGLLLAMLTGFAGILGATAEGGIQAGAAFLFLLPMAGLLGAIASGGFVWLLARSPQRWARTGPPSESSDPGSDVRS